MTAILRVTPIALWFNYINRSADALGCGLENSDAVKVHGKIDYEKNLCFLRIEHRRKSGFFAGGGNRRRFSGAK
jgi:hypothetical protein